MENQTQNETTQPVMWRLKVRKDIVEELTELKWKARSSRAALVRRILQVGIQLWELERFEELERELFDD